MEVNAAKPMPTLDDGETTKRMVKIAAVMTGIHGAGLYFGAVQGVEHMANLYSVVVVMACLFSYIVSGAIMAIVVAGKDEDSFKLSSELTRLSKHPISIFANVVNVVVMVTLAWYGWFWLFGLTLFGNMLSALSKWIAREEIKRQEKGVAA